MNIKLKNYTIRLVSKKIGCNKIPFTSNKGYL
jgi:hypothetical protein